MTDLLGAVQIDIDTPSALHVVVVVVVVLVVLVVVLVVVVVVVVNLSKKSDFGTMH